ncbi:hypothetical protein E2C01_099321 [Portunus trituberculatus]|uniref:Uncharacterized protein n=1 Tax=Portunus trituberculatus TaxID=210409 RepID=A0A5B7KAI0_PORTR|nr:hypothetical protein [Portunus trituberculatus]
MPPRPSWAQVRYSLPAGWNVTWRQVLDCGSPSPVSAVPGEAASRSHVNAAPHPNITLRPRSARHRQAPPAGGPPLSRSPGTAHRANLLQSQKSQLVVAWSLCGVGGKRNK